MLWKVTQGGPSNRWIGNEFDRPGIGLKPEAEKFIALYPWPGNIRELENALKRAVILLPREEPSITPGELRFLEHAGGSRFSSGVFRETEDPQKVFCALADLIESGSVSFRELEKRLFMELHDRYRGDIPGIVKATSIPRGWVSICLTSSIPGRYSARDGPSFSPGAVIPPLIPKENFSEEEIRIARGREPLAKIIPLELQKKERHFGCAKGIVPYMADDFDEPLEESDE